MSDSKAAEAAQEKRESTATAPPAYDAGSVAGSEDLYFVTPQATGQNEKEVSRNEPKPQTSDEIKRDWERIDGPSTGEGLAEPGSGESSKQEAPPLPPKTPIDDEPVTVEKNVHFEDFDQAPALPTRPVFDDEELARQLQAEEDEMAPQLPARHVSFSPSLASNETHSTYTFSWRRPLTDYSTLTITPNTDAPCYWRLNYQSKYLARLYRYYPSQARVDSDFPARQVAEVKFPEFIWPGCGPTITFEPHEEAAAPERVGRFMKCTGWMTPRYTLEMPALGGAKCTWRAVRPSKKDVNGAENGEAGEVWWQGDAEAGAQPQEHVAQRTGNGEPQVTTVGDLIAQAKACINDDSWTPYPKQHFVMGTSANSGRVIAEYTRAAPWNKNAGVLSIITSQDGSTSPEYIESIIIACAAMVGMQDRMGLASSLMEASTESVMASRRRGNMPTPNSIRPYLRFQKRTSVPANEYAVEDEAAQKKTGLQRENSIQRSLKRLSAQLVPRSAGAAPDKKLGVDEKAEVAVRA